MKNGILTGLVFLVMLSSPITVQAQTLLYDPFDTKSYETWDWYDVGTGYSQVADGIATLTITAESTSETTSNSEIRDYASYPFEGKWLFVSMEMRLRCSNDNWTSGKGNRGWGLWNRYFGAGWGDPNPANCVWFFSYSPDSYDPSEGFKAVVAKNDVIQMADLSAYDMTQWHIYRIDWTPQNASFYIDDELVGSFANPPNVELLAFIWIDNAVVTCSGDPLVCEGGHLDLDEDQYIEVDYVRITQLPTGWTAATSAEASTLGRSAIPTSQSINLLAILFLPLMAVFLWKAMRKRR